MGLVDYPSDTENFEADDENQRSTSLPPAKRRRILPGLPETFRAGPKDDVAQHQGRTRSRPYVDGDYNAHIYLTLEVEKPFRDMLGSLSARAQSLCAQHELHSLLDPPQPEGASSKLPTLHISLTHPLPLRRSQINDLQSDLQNKLRDQGLRAFRLSLAAKIRMYYNGRRYGGEGVGGRAFLALRVGAGSTELRDLLDKVVHPILRPLHLPLYHENPEFHTSFAWCLLEARAPNGSPGRVPSSDAEIDFNPDEENENSSDISKTPYTETVMSHIDQEYEHLVLSSQPAGGWTVDGINLKVAKDVFYLPLQ